MHLGKRIKTGEGLIAQIKKGYSVPSRKVSKKEILDYINKLFDEVGKNGERNNNYRYRYSSDKGNNLYI